MTEKKKGKKEPEFNEDFSDWTQDIEKEKKAPIEKVGIKVIQSTKNREVPKEPQEESVTYYWVAGETPRIAIMTKKEGKTIVVLKEAKYIKVMRSTLQELAKQGLRHNYI